MRINPIPRQNGIVILFFITFFESFVLAKLMSSIGENLLVSLLVSIHASISPAIWNVSDGGVFCGKSEVQLYGLAISSSHFIYGR